MANKVFSSEGGLSSYILYVPSIVCGYLAYWQYQRSEWKNDLIKVRTEMLKQPAEDIFRLDALEEQKKVCVSGHYQHQKSLFVGPRPRSIPGMGIQSGYILITPLHNKDRNAAVLVNRGWVPASWLDDIEAVSKAADAQLPQMVGLVQPSETPSRAVPNNKPECLEFHWLNVPEMATTCGLPPDTPLVQRLSEDPSTAQPVTRQSPLAAAQQPRDVLPRFPIPKNRDDLLHFTTMPTDHLIYCATWAGLCVVLGYMGRQAILKPPRRSRLVNALDSKSVFNTGQQKP